jgi:hypothetical protein
MSRRGTDEIYLAGVWSARPDWTTLANWEAAKSDYRISITQATDLISPANQYLCR